MEQDAEARDGRGNLQGSAVVLLVYFVLPRSYFLVTSTTSGSLRGRWKLAAAATAVWLGVSRVVQS
jgi:hypothetical protein